MYFIGDNEYIVFGTNLGQLDQCVFFSRRHRLDYEGCKGIRTFAMLIDDRFKILEIHLVNVVYCFERVVDTSRCMFSGTMRKGW